MSDLEFHVLLALGEGPSHGYAIGKAMEEQSGGRLDPTTGALYQVLRRLSDDELIAAVPTARRTPIHAGAISPSPRRAGAPRRQRRRVSTRWCGWPASAGSFRSARDGDLSLAASAGRSLARARLRRGHGRHAGRAPARSARRHAMATRAASGGVSWRRWRRSRGPSASATAPAARAGGDASTTGSRRAHGYTRTGNSPGAAPAVAQPRIHAASVLTLALAIGANAAIFAVVERVVLNPLPYPESDRLIDAGSRIRRLKVASRHGDDLGPVLHLRERRAVARVAPRSTHAATARCSATASPSGSR